MLDTFLVILPVFLLVGAGFVAVKTSWMPAAAGDVLNQFSLRMAVPCLLFANLYRLDLAQAFAPRVLIAFYTGALSVFVLGILLSRLIFRDDPERSVAVGFAACFSNTLLLGLPIVDRAYGPAEVTVILGIISIHGLTLYPIGMMAMEAARPGEANFGARALAALKRSVANPLVFGLSTGFLANLSGVQMPESIMAGIDLLGQAAIPSALVGIGISMSGLKLQAEISETLVVSALLILVHPAIAWLISTQIFELDPAQLRGAVMLAAMPAGVNTYLFALLYNTGTRLAASTVLVSTILSIGTITAWIAFLP